MKQLKASFEKYTFDFNFPGGTSRGILTQKDSWFLKLWYDDNPEKYGIGEISILPILSPESPKKVETRLSEIVKDPNFYIDNFDTVFENTPAIKFGFETALLDLNSKNSKILFPSEFTKGHEGITINGLIWMGDKELMLTRIKEKIAQGFSCLKLKVGAINFNDELDLLKAIRKQFSKEELELRVDANGAFSSEDALQKLDSLAKFYIHSIEQPIKQGQWEAMHKLCLNTPIPIALDEELIGIENESDQITMMETIKPDYLIFKPSLIGGLKSTKKWKNLAESKGIKWWVTSALEGNIGLNAIAQWTYTQNNSMPQGLGTGQVFSNNIESPLYIKKDSLWYNPSKSFNL